MENSAVTFPSTLKWDENSKFYHLFLDGIKDIYWAEKEMVDSLPDMQDAATSAELKSALGMHLNETIGHVSRLEKVFSLMKLEPDSKKCKAMAGLMREARELISDTEDDSMVRDCAIIFAAQKIEHYEIGTYGTLCRWAKQMGKLDIAGLLYHNLSEEKEADEKLTAIAELNINNEGINE
ncbi:ferritin-like domain-containing protein [Arachidicoccus sp.]|jgi:ferritin-like metal-binding protein YciE|uniref:ferritin-like domain-containing protein n=1 Tax=Arachidicoccus sp. TaxID=1872624 RepID=UPI003D1BC20D